MIDEDNITASDLYTLIPLIFVISLFSIVVCWFLNLFGFETNPNKPKSLRQQQREYRRMEKKIIKQVNKGG